jgi:tetratricopeptide (TPR) repeat protein
MKYYQRALILCSLFTFTLQPAALLADDASAKKPEEQFMEMLSQMMNAGGAGSGQIKDLQAQIDQQQKQAAVKPTPNPNGPTVEDALGPFFQRLTGLAGASAGALGAMAQADLAHEQNDNAVNNASSLVGKAAIASLSGKHAEAANLYKQAIESDPENPTAYFGLATESAKLENKDTALLALTKAVTIDKKYADQASREPAFDSLRDDAKFKEILAKR